MYFFRSQTFGRLREHMNSGIYISWKEKELFVSPEEAVELEVIELVLESVSRDTEDPSAVILALGTQVVQARCLWPAYSHALAGAQPLQKICPQTRQ